MLSDVSEEWEEKYNKLYDEYYLYKSEKEQKASDDWMTFSYLTNDNNNKKEEISVIRGNSVWINGNYEDKEKITGYNLLFIRDKNTKTYMAVLDGSKIPVILAEDAIKDNLKLLNYPKLIKGEIFQILQRTMPQNIDERALIPYTHASLSSSRIINIFHSII